MAHPVSVLPIRMISKVVRGFGRGSQDLGIPTANVCLDKDVLHSSVNDGDSLSLPTGIYWGFARVGEASGDDSSDSIIGRVYTAAISIGYNPTYNNKELTVEPHLIAEAGHPRRHASSTGETQFQDFYEKKIVLSVVGYIRPELPFEGLEKLVDAIKKDINDSIELAKSTDQTVIAEKQWVQSASNL